MSYKKQDFKSGDILFSRQLNAMDDQIAENETKTSAIAEDLSELNSAIGVEWMFNSPMTTSGTGKEIGKFYPTYGKKYLFSFFGLAANRVYLYEFDINGDYTTFSNEVTFGLSEYEIEYSPTVSNVDYVRIYAASPSGYEKGGNCIVYNLSNNGDAKRIKDLQDEIYSLEQSMNITNKNSLMFIALEDGGIDSTGEKNSAENMVRFANKIKVSQEEYKVSITSEKSINACYCATFNTNGELIERLVVPSTDVFSDFASGEYGFFITPGSSVVFIQPYFLGGTETISTANVSRPAINKPTKKDIKILACGDSICRGARNKFNGFAGGNGFRFKNIGVGNSSLATNSGTGVENIPNTFAAETSYTPDVIISDGGINDYHYNSPLGVVPTYPVTTDEEASALNRSTVMGGAAYLFYQMVKKFPDARRYFVITHKTLWNTGATPTYCPTENNEQEYTQKDLHDALVALCNVYGVVVIDVYNNSIIDTKFGQYRSPIEWATDASLANQYMVDADGVHPTAKGYIYGYAPFVKAALANDLK